MEKKNLRFPDLLTYKLIQKNSFNSTLLKYFLSYFILLFLLLVSFFCIINSRTREIYSANQKNQVEKRLDVLHSQLERELLAIAQGNGHIRSAVVNERLKNNTAPYFHYESAKFLKQFTSINAFVDSIVMIDFTDDTVISSGRFVDLSEDTIRIYTSSMPNTGKPPTTLSLDAVTQAAENSLTTVTGDLESYLLYIPSNNNDNYVFFYIINSMELNSLFRDNMTDGMYSLALTDSEHQIIAGINTPPIAQLAIDSIPVRTTTYALSSDTSLSVSTGLFGSYSLVALYSDSSMLAQLSEAFKSTLSVISFLGLLGILVIWLAMQMTYAPLHKLTAKLVDRSVQGKGYIEQLDQVFTTVLSEKELLQAKIDKYHLTMQKSILDSILSGSQAEQATPINIDHFFDAGPDSRIYVLRVGFQRKDTKATDIADFLDNMLPGDDICVTLEANPGYAVFLLNYMGTESHKDEVVHQLLVDLYTEFGCTCAVSGNTTSPLEIPSLYEQARSASDFWTEHPVIVYSSIAQRMTEQNNPQKDYQYPQQQLSDLSKNLRELSFDQASSITEELLNKIDQLYADDSPLPEFYVRCVLIDIVTIIINCMNQMNITFETYSELYLNTLFYCRSCTWQDKKEEIRSSLHQLLALYQNQMQNAAIHTAKISKIMEESYSSPDLSISVLADHFHVSIAYMSYLFKKKFHENFSDYLWNMRLEKARELLATTSLSIDQISVQVGYLNSSSFRRKFKQETGETPSAYRDNHKWTGTA